MSSPDTILDGGSLSIVLTGDDVSRVLEVTSGGSLTLINVAIVNGRAPIGAGLLNSGNSVTLIGCSFTSNIAQGSDGLGPGEPGISAGGGAIHSIGSLTALNCSFQHNRAVGGEGAAGLPGVSTNVPASGGKGGTGGSAFGGAVFARQKAVISNCVFFSNSTIGGAGGSGGPGATNYLRFNSTLGHGGSGGQGGTANGGAIDFAGLGLFKAITVLSNTCIGGTGGAGGRGGADNHSSRGGNSGLAGWGGSANGAGMMLGDGEVQLKNSHLLDNGAVGGKGGLGTSSPFVFEGLNGHGGGGGSVQGAAICIDAAHIHIERSSFAGNVGAGGAGAAGASSHQYGYMFYPAQAGSGAAGGGAYGTIFNSGRMTVLACTLSSNLLFGGNGGAGGDGGRPQARLGSSAGSASHGAAASGGGIYQLNEASVINCTVVGNECHGGDGAAGGRSGWGNSAVSLYGGDGGSGGAATGGGVWTGLDAKTAIESVTLAGNKVCFGNGGRGGSGYRRNSWEEVDGSDGTNGIAEGCTIYAEREVRIRNSILSNSTTNVQVVGALIDRGHNLCSDNSCGFRNKTSLNNNDPLLDALADNGGATLTMRPLPGSPAIDRATRIPTMQCDQRDFVRSRGTAPDIGALETGAPPGITIRGRITSDGTGVAGIKVKLGPHIAMSDALGEYEFMGVEPGRYVVRPISRGYWIRPTTRTIRVSEDLTLPEFVIIQAIGN